MTFVVLGQTIFLNSQCLVLAREEYLQQLASKVNNLAIRSLLNEECNLDVPFTLEELGGALGCVQLYLDWKEIPTLFKLGFICQVYRETLLSLATTVALQ